MRKRHIIGSIACIATAAVVTITSASAIFGDTASGIATSSYEAVTVASEDEAKLVAVDKQNVMAANAQYAVIHNATILYANPNISLTGLGTAQPGQRYSVVNVSEGWVDVTTDSGQMAFIQRSDVTLESESAQAVPTPQPVAAAQPAVQQTSSGRHLGKFRITHYCSCAACCGAYASVPAIGASGAALTAGASIAVDPAQIPYGTRVMINGNVYVAQDTGVGANCIDIFVGNDHAAAYASGMYYADVYVLD